MPMSWRKKLQQRSCGEPIRLDNSLLAQHNPNPNFSGTKVNTPLANNPTTQDILHNAKTFLEAETVGYHAVKARA